MNPLAPVLPASEQPSAEQATNGGQLAAAALDSKAARRKSTFGRGTGAAVSREVDLALAVMCSIQKPGEAVSSNVISEVAGMSHSAAWQIEQRALKKLRRRLDLDGADLNHLAKKTASQN